MNEHTDRVGARPMTAFQTTPIILNNGDRRRTRRERDNIDNDDDDSTNDMALMGIARKPSHEFDDFVVAIPTIPSEDSIDNNNTSTYSNKSILMTNDKLGLLKDPSADPPIETTPKRRKSELQSNDDNHHHGDATNNNGDDDNNDNDDDESEEYHSPLEDEDEMRMHEDADEDRDDDHSKRSNPLSAYDYGRRWDLDTPPRRKISEQAESSIPTTPVSLADAAAATAFLNNSNDDLYEVPHIGRTPLGTTTIAYDPTTVRDTSESDLSFQDVLTDFSSTLQPMDALSVNTGASSSSSGSTRRRRLRRTQASESRPRHIPETIQEGRDNRLRASLDAGMLAVRRWIQRRRTTTTTPTSMTTTPSRTTRTTTATIATTTQSNLRLGELDLLALSGQQQTIDDLRFPPRPERVPRERALSEPESSSLRNIIFQRVTNGSSHGTPPHSGGSWRQQTTETNELALAAFSSSLFHTTNETMEGPPTTTPPATTVTMTPGAVPDDSHMDPHREARMRWIRINRRFHLTITAMALLFSLLLFAILVSWVVLTSAYVVSIEKSCDVPLKLYFWLATLQLILDVFRNDIMRFVFRYDVRQQERIPVRVILYNFAYLVYALIVLRVGVKSVFTSPDATCSSTASELYKASTTFVSLSIAAWSVIFFGYLVPFCVVAVLLTWNGYNPANDPENRANVGSSLGGVLPSAFTNAGAPPGTVDRLQTVLLEEFPDHYPRECCICMCDFVAGEVIVATNCDHVFHKRCCKEWLRHARTCPVCRTDILTSVTNNAEEAADDSSGTDDDDDDDNDVEEMSRPAFRPSAARPFPGREEFRAEVVNLIQLLRHDDRIRRRQQAAAADNSTDPREGESQSDGGGGGGGLPLGSGIEMMSP